MPKNSLMLYVKNIPFPHLARRLFVGLVTINLIGKILFLKKNIMDKILYGGICLFRRELVYLKAFTTLN